MLFSTYTNETPDECVQSVLSIRGFLTDTLGAGGIGDTLANPLRLMRRYCRQFLDQVGATEPNPDSDASLRHLYQHRQWRMNDYWFGEALGALRQGVGTQVAVIAAAYGIDVEDDLARWLPPPDDTDRAISSHADPTRLPHGRP